MRKTGTRLAAAALVALLALIWLACGNEFRPVATPIFPPGGDPQGQRQAVSINNAGGAIGSTTNINVSGDTVVASHTVGRGPVQAATTPGGARIFVVNLGDDSVSSYATAQAGSVPVTISMPAGSAPVFAHTRQSSAMYVANSGTGTVGVINAATNLLTDLVNVGSGPGSKPVSLAELPSATKLYCVNQNDGTVTVISTVDKLVVATIGVGNMPSFAVTNDTGAWVFVANQADGTVSVIDTATDMVHGTITVGNGPNFLFFDNSLKRVYVTNSTGNSVSIIRTDVDPTLNLPVTVTVGATPLSVTALADGSRAYVANSGSGNVSVIVTSNNTVSKTITVGTNPVSIASSSDGSKVYVTNRGSNNVSIIRTTDDTVVLNAPTTSSQPVWVLTVP